MTAKEWLQRAGKIDAEIISLKEQRALLYSELISCTAPTDVERLSGTKSNTYQLKMSMYIDLCNVLEQKEIALLAVKTEIITAIENVPDNISRIILFERYINLKTWEYIAGQINKSDKWTRTRLHSKALKYINVK